MPLVVLVANVVPNVVQPRGALQPFPRLVREGEIILQLIEELERQVRNVRAVLTGFSEVAGQTGDAAPPRIGEVLGLLDTLGVPGDEVEQHAFAQCPGTRHEILRTDQAHDAIRQAGPCHNQVDALGVQPFDAQPFLAIGLD